MEIWQILDSRGVGGIESHVLNLARGLKGSGCRVRVVFLSHYGQDHPIHRDLVSIGAGVSYANGLIGLSKLLRKGRPTIVHTHGYKGNIFGRLLGTLYQIPIVASYHAGEPGTGKLRIYTSIDRLTSRFSCKLAVSQQIAETLAGRTTVLDNFVNIPRQSASLSGSRIAFVGRLSEEKGPETFCRLADRLNSLMADVYGDGPLRKLLELKYGDRVRFHGMVSDISNRLADHDLVIMPSLHEGLPMAALEAMARGVPVAAFGVGGLPQLIEHGENGFLAVPGDFDGLAALVAEYFQKSSDERRVVGNQARQTIATRYSTKTQTRKVIGIYQSQLPSQNGEFHAIAQ